MATLTKAKTSKVAAEKVKKSFWQQVNIRQTYPLYLMLIPVFVFLAIFHYYTMYGAVMAFEDFQPWLGFAHSPWVGLKNFQELFSQPDVWRVVRNTVIIALGKLLFEQLASIVFALALNEVGHMVFKRTLQTVVYLPHFLSWVILGGIFLDIFSTTGIVNQAITALGFKPVGFFSTPALFPPLLIGTSVWKSFGWGAIIYLAALTQVDPNLHEAAAIDGAGRLRRIWHINLVAIRPIVILWATLSLEGVLSAGFDQILVLYNPLVQSTGDVIDTYVYRVGLLQQQYSFSAAVGLLKEVVSLGLIGISTWMAFRFSNYRIF